MCQNIKSLEDQLGVKLFHSHPRGVEPTSEAIRLYDAVKPAFVAINFGEESLKMLDENSSGILRIGCPSHIASHVLAKYFCEFKKKYKKIKLMIYSKAKNELLDMLTKRNIDLMVNVAAVPANFVSHKLAMLNYTFFTTKDFCLNHDIEPTITKGQLGELPLILQDLSYTNIKTLMSSLQLSLSPLMEMETTESVYSMVLNGLGIGYCIENLIDTSFNNDQIVKLTIANTALPKAELAYVHNKGKLSKIARIFVEGLVAYCKMSFC